MRQKGMISRPFLVLFLIVTASVLLPAAVFAVTADSIVGKWGHTSLQHDNDDGEWGSTAGTITFNSDGTGTNIIKFNDGGTIMSETKNFTYTMTENSDGSFTMTLTYADDIQAFRFALSDDGNMFIVDGTLYDDQNIIIAIRMDESKAYSNADLSGDYYEISYEHNSLDTPHGYYRALSSVFSSDGSGNYTENGQFNGDGTIQVHNAPGTYNIDSSGSVDVSTSDGGRYTGYITGNGKLFIASNPTTAVTDWTTWFFMKKGDMTYSTAGAAGTWAMAKFGDDNGTSFEVDFGTVTCDGSGNCTYSYKNRKNGVITYGSSSFTISVAPDGTIGTYSGVPYFAVGNNGNTVILNDSFDSDTSKRNIYIGVRCSACSNLTGGFPSCTYTVSPTSQTFTSSGGTGSVTVTPSSSSCTWTASESFDWITITSGSSGTGNGTVNYSISANTTTSSRTGNLTIAGQTLAITQGAAADATPPTVGITNPANGSIVAAQYVIEGAASDSGSGVSKVELQVTDGTYYLTSQRWFSNTSTWIALSGTSFWSFNTGIVNWGTGKTYTVTAKATDTAGNTAQTSVTFTYAGSGQGYTTLSLDLSSQTILQNATIGATGKLTRLPDNGTSLSGLKITLTITSPTGTTTTQTTTTYDTYGHYKFTGVSGFTQKGTYTIKASFDGTTTLASSDSESKTVLAGASAGYAILVEGKISNQEGLDSHNKTTNRIYETLKERGFIDDNINYFNFNTAQTGADASPTKAGIQTAISTWAKERINGSPAPLYIIMVDHGNPGSFYIGSETITPTDLNTWLNSLESGLNTSAQSEKRIVIIGACYSGSFVPSISKTGRVIITSATKDEQSYKGPNEPDGVRSGEYFLEELFKDLKKGNSIKGSFEDATDKAEKYTRKGGSKTNTINQYLDNAIQHPLLDDNGDGKGSNVLSVDYGDGKTAKDLYLGTGLTYDTNASENPAEITQVTDTQYLNTSALSVTLWAKANDNSVVSSAWLEIRAPSKTLTSTGGSNQQEVNIPRELMTYNTSASRWESTYNSFTEEGMYEVFYFVRDTLTSEISSMKRSVVYKNKTGNNAPNTFNLVSPDNDTEQKTVLQLDWEESKDPDGNNVTYTVMISKYSNFSTIDYQKEEITYSSTEIGIEANLSDLTTYYWKVRAVDSYGATRDSTQTWYFTTNNTNGLPGIIKGYIKNETTGLGIANATISSSTGGSTKSLPNGKYVLFTDSGTLTLTITKTGYTTKTEAITMSPGELLTKNINLSPQTGQIFTDVASGSVFYSYTNAIYQADITVGCGSGNYCPDSNVTRGQMSAFIIRALYGEDFNYTTTGYFTDAPSTNTFFKYIQKLKDDGLTVNTGKYNIDDYVTRGQMAAFIIRALYGESFTYTITPYFTDVPSTNVFFKYVQKMKDQGITVTTGTYNVDSYVTREQMSAFLARAFLGME